MSRVRQVYRTVRDKTIITVSVCPWQPVEIYPSEDLISCSKEMWETFWERESEPGPWRFLRCTTTKHSSGRLLVFRCLPLEVKRVSSITIAPSDISHGTATCPECGAPLKQLFTSQYCPQCEG